VVLLSSQRLCLLIYSRVFRCPNEGNNTGLWLLPHELSTDVYSEGSELSSAMPETAHN
jgi:hypothetical protein